MGSRSGWESNVVQTLYGVASRNLRIARLDEADDDIVLIHDGDLHVEGNLQIDYRSGPFRVDEQRVVGLWVQGDLRVDGCLLNYEDDESSPFLQVDGDLDADAVATGSSIVSVKGRLTAATILGVYNHGHLSARRIVSDLVMTEHAVVSKTARNGYWGGGGPIRFFRRGKEVAKRACALEGMFNRSLLKGAAGDKWLDMARAQKWLAKGKPIVREPRVTIEEQTLALVSKKLMKAESQEELHLSHKGLVSLPSSIAKFTNLKVLEAQFNRLRALPSAARRLKRLEILHLQSNELTELPDWIGELAELRFLSLQGNWGITHLPASIGDLSKLERLDLSRTSIQDLPESLARCTRLKELDLSRGAYPSRMGPFMTKLPEVVAKLPSLERLHVADSLICTLPRRTFKSPHLRTISAKDTPMVNAIARHPKVKPVKANRTWPIDHVCDYWLKKPSYDSRARRYRIERFAARFPYIVAMLNVAAAEPAVAERRVGKKLRALVADLDTQGDVAFVVRDCFSAALGSLEGIKAKKALLKWLRPMLTRLSEYETPVDRHARFHLLSKEEQTANRARDLGYYEYYVEEHGVAPPLCLGNEVLPIANRRYAPKSGVLAWEFDERLLKKEPTDLKSAFRQGTWLRSTDFGFAFPHRYWGPQSWR